MLDSSVLTETNSSESKPSKWTLPLSAASIAICLFGNLGAIGLTGPDEPRYVWIARAMAETNDWVTPRLYAQPWFEKPILYYWAAAVGFVLHLPAEWAARLPSAFAALGATLAIAWLAKKHYGGNANSLSSPALLAPVLFATSVAAIGFSRAATPDMLFSAAIAAAMASAASVLQCAGALRGASQSEPAGSSAHMPLMLFGGFLGLAVLAKGPAAIVLAGGAIAIWTLVTQRWRAAIRLAHPLAILALGAVAIPWYAICAARNPDFLRVFFWEHNVERYTTPMFHHRQPFWYYGPITLLALIPWTALLWPVVREGLRLWREKSWTDSPGFFFACWAVWPVVFFSFSQSKLPGYILPAIPPLTLVCAITFSRALSPSAPQTRTMLLAIGGTWLVLGVAAPFGVTHRMHVQFIGPVTVSLGLFAAILALAVGALVTIASLRGRPAAAILLCVVSVATLVEIARLRFLPSIDSIVSARPHAEFMRNDQHAERIFTYQLSRSWVYGLNFYFRRQLPEWSPTDPRPALVLTTQAGLDQVRKLGRVSGDIEQTQPGLIYVPIMPAPTAR